MKLCVPASQVTGKCGFLHIQSVHTGIYVYDLAKDSYYTEQSFYVLALSFKYSSYYHHLSKPKTSSNHIVQINVYS